MIIDEERDTSTTFQEGNEIEQSQDSAKVSKQIFKCSVCNKTYSRKEKLTHHVQFIHEGRKKPHKCSICDKRFVQKTHLNRHLKRKHKCRVKLSLNQETQV